MFALCRSRRKYILHECKWSKFRRKIKIGNLDKASNKLSVILQTSSRKLEPCEEENMLLRQIAYRYFGSYMSLYCVRDEIVT